LRQIVRLIPAPTLIGNALSKSFPPKPYLSLVVPQISACCAFQFEKSGCKLLGRALELVSISAKFTISSGKQEQPG
jgi:hypothetical protein